MNNPFIITGNIAPEYFCDRMDETKKIVISTCVAGANTVSEKC